MSESAEAREATPQEREFFKAARIRLSRHLVGFVGRSHSNGVEKGEQVGSGTLVAWKNNYGILTAAHVVRALPVTGEVGIVRFDQRTRQRTKIKMQNTLPFKIGPGSNHEDGPDLGFLNLSNEVVGSLAAASEFFDLGRHAEDILAPRRELSLGFDAVVGVIAERTRTLISQDRKSTESWFEASVEVGKPTQILSRNEYDYVSFLPFALRSEPPPESYGGVSGGGWWKVFAKRNKNGDMMVERMWLCGVPFYEYPVQNGYRSLKCHGPKGLFTKFLPSLGF